jgi:hypothetical protein
VLEVLQKKICHGFVLFGFMNFLCLKSKTLWDHCFEFLLN